MGSEISLYNMDCVEFMKDCKDNQFDLAIVDPPYGLNIGKKNSSGLKVSINSLSNSKYYGNQRWDSEIPDKSYFNDLKRITKNQIIWGANYFGLKGGMIYWNKNVAMPSYSDGELAYCSLINSIKSFNYTWNGMFQDNMKNKEKRIHPTQKPIALYKYLLSNFAKEGDTIIDTHLGSGSICIACYDLGFSLTGIELDGEYYKSALERLELHKEQLTFFDLKNT